MPNTKTILRHLANGTAINAFVGSGYLMNETNREFISPALNHQSEEHTPWDYVKAVGGPVLFIAGLGFFYLSSKLARTEYSRLENTAELYSITLETPPEIQEERGGGRWANWRSHLPSIPSFSFRNPLHGIFKSSSKTPENKELLVEEEQNKEENNNPNGTPTLASTPNQQENQQ